MRPHRRQPTRLPRPWDSPGKNTGVGRHFLLQCMKVKSQSEVAQSCPILSEPMDCSLPGSLLHPWHFPVKSTGVGCHCLLRRSSSIYSNFNLNSVQPKTNDSIVINPKMSLTIVIYEVNSLISHSFWISFVLRCVLCALLLSRVQLFVTPWTVACQSPLSMGFSRQEDWNGLPCPPPEDLPNTGTEPRSPTLRADPLLSELPGKTCAKINCV